jgi:hypothetical protein
MRYVLDGRARMTVLVSGTNVDTYELVCADRKPWVPSIFATRQEPRHALLMRPAAAGNAESSGFSWQKAMMNSVSVSLVFSK